MNLTSNDFEFPNELYSRILPLGDAKEFGHGRLNIQAEPILRGLLSAALVPLWGFINRPMIWRLEKNIRQEIREGGLANIGLGFAWAGESVAENEILGAPVGWSVLAPGNWLGEGDGPVSVEEIPPNEWLLLPEMEFGYSGLVDFFAKSGQRQIMASRHLETSVAARCGCAIFPDVTGNRCPPGTIRRRFVGLPPIQVRMYLPKGEGLSNEVQAVVTNLRRLVRDGFLSGGNNGTTSSTSESRSNQESPDAEDALIVEGPSEEAAMPIAEVLP